jgi:hypothetical protein
MGVLWRQRSSMDRKTEARLEDLSGETLLTELPSGRSSGVLFSACVVSEQAIRVEWKEHWQNLVVRKRVTFAQAERGWCQV